MREAKVAVAVAVVAAVAVVVAVAVAGAPARVCPHTTPAQGAGDPGTKTLRFASGPQGELWWGPEDSLVLFVSSTTSSNGQTTVFVHVFDTTIRKSLNSPGLDKAQAFIEAFVAGQPIIQGAEVVTDPSTGKAEAHVTLNFSSPAVDKTVELQLD